MVMVGCMTHESPREQNVELFKCFRTDSPPDFRQATVKPEPTIVHACRKPDKNGIVQALCGIEPPLHPTGKPWGKPEGMQQECPQCKAKADGLTEPS